MKKTSLILTVFASILLLTSCVNTKDFSISNPDIKKLTYKAQELMNKEDYLGAIARLESVKDLNPNLPEIHYNLGVAYYRTAQYEKAVDSLENALKLNKNLKDAYFTLAVVYEEMAVKESETTKQVKDDREKSGESSAKIKEYYEKAKENFAFYKDLTGISEDTEKVEGKIKEFDEKIEKISENLIYTNH
ncbi:MAG TPA: tetratricopeptide repeat protein [Candidatus Gastranaerophilales bacterium]|nr:tetratricopeptide repeat protein [Candidatus Gastranaerophilales bacterium]